MRKLLLILFIATISGLETKAQCDADFNFTISQNQVSFNAAPAYSTAKHIWFFGDGNIDSYLTSPLHVYNQPGAYMVVHVIQDSINGCVDSVFKMVTLNFADSCNINASFTYQANPSQPQQIHFTALPNQSQLTYIWNFGDNQGGWGPAPSHYYTQPGTYGVVLVVLDSIHNCMDSVWQYVNVTGPVDSCNLNASFTYHADSLQPLHINFTASPNQPQLIYSWNFGDGHTGWGQSPSHTYSYTGNYAVTLIVYDSTTNCTDSALLYVNVFGPIDTCSASFTYTISQGQVSFTASSNQTIASQLWIISPIPDSTNTVVLTSSNPVYNLPDSGLYYVCLVVTTTSGCTDWYCDSILFTGRYTGRIAVIPSYPNPVQSELSIRINLNLDAAALIQYRVSNLAGNTVYQSQRQGQQGVNTVSVPVQQLGRGQYFIDIMYGNNKKRSVFQKL